MRRILLALAFVCGLAAVPSVAALPQVPPAPVDPCSDIAYNPLYDQTGRVACGVAVGAQQAADCALTDRYLPVVPTCAPYVTRHAGDVVGYALCYGNVGFLHWVPDCT